MTARRIQTLLFVCIALSSPCDVSAQQSSIRFRTRVDPLANLIHQLDCMAGRIACTRDAYTELWRGPLHWDGTDEARLAEWRALQLRYRASMDLPVDMPRLEYPLNTPAASGRLDLPAKLRLAGVAGDSAAYDAALRMVMSARDAAAVHAIIAHFRPRFERWWQDTASVQLAVAANALSPILQSTAMRDVINRSARFYDAQLPAQTDLTINLIFLPGQRRGATATQVEDQSIVEVPVNDSPANRIGVIVHEIAHYLYGEAGAARHATLANELSATPDGAAAYNVLNEAVATAIGNGIVERMHVDSARFAGYSARPRSFYNDKYIDAVAKAIMPLVERSLADGTSLFSSSFGREYLAVVGRTVPHAAADPLIALKHVALYAASDSLDAAYDTIVRAVRPGVTFGGTSSVQMYPRLNAVVLLLARDVDRLSRLGDVIPAEAVRTVRARAKTERAFTYVVRRPGGALVHIVVGSDRDSVVGEAVRLVKSE